MTYAFARNGIRISIKSSATGTYSVLLACARTAAIIGGIAGAVAGNAVENGVAKRAGVEITVRLDNGDLRAITQSATGEMFQAGDRVRLLSSAGVTRVTH